MKKYLFYLLFGCWAIVAFACDSSEKNEEEQNPPADVVERIGKLSVDGTFLVNAQGEKVQLKGVSYGWHNWWPRFYNASSVATFAQDWNATLVRAAMGVDVSGAYLENPTHAIQCVTAVVDAAIAEGIYVIIDWHSHNIHTDAAKQFFTQMANKYKDYPNAIYEIFNEPINDSWQTVKDYSTEVIRTIRAIDPDNIILVGCPHWDQDINLAADDPITGFSNLMYVLHFYAATHGQYLRDRGDYAIQKGLPIFVSECAGMEASGNGGINRQEWTAWVQWMNSHSISWAAWSIADKDETCSMMLQSASSEGPWSDSDLKEWGRIVKSELTGN